MKVSDALDWCIAYYYKQWENECDCEFFGVETEAAKKIRINKEITKITSQEFDLDTGFQCNSYSKFGGKK